MIQSFNFFFSVCSLRKAFKTYGPCLTDNMDSKMIGKVLKLSLTKEEVQSAFHESKVFNESLTEKDKQLAQMFEDYSKAFPCDHQYIDVLHELHNSKDIDDEISRCTMAHSVLLLKKRASITRGY